MVSRLSGPRRRLALLLLATATASAVAVAPGQPRARERGDVAGPRSADADASRSAPADAAALPPPVAPRGRARTPPNPVRVERDVHYDGFHGPALDVHRPASDVHRRVRRSAPRPGVIVLHGGAWRSGKKERVAPIAHALARAGFVAFSVDYTLATYWRSGFPRQTQELRSAVRFIRRNAAYFGVDPTRIGAIGSSAGAHLAALIATDARGRLTAGERLRAVVTWSAPLDLAARDLGRRLRGKIASFLGCRPCPRRATAASPIAHVTADDPPMMIVNSRRELVPAGQAQRMARRLRAAGVRRRLWILPGSRHSPRFFRTALGPTISFLRRQLH